MSKRIMTTGAIAMAGITMMTGCSLLMTPEQKAIKTFNEMADILFEYENEEDVENIKSDLKERYDLIDFEDEVKDDALVEGYESIFNGETVAKRLMKSLKDFDYETQYSVCETLEESDFYIKENPKLYVGDGDFLELEGMYLIYNDEPLVATLHDDGDEEEVEIIMPIIVDKKGMIKAYAVIPEERREIADETFKSKKGIGANLKDLEQFTNDLLDSMNESNNSSSNDLDLNTDTTVDLEPTDEEVEKEKEDVSFDANSDYLKKSTLDYEEIDDDGDVYYVADDSRKEVWAFYSNDSDGQYLSLDTPMKNVNQSEIQEELKIVMNSFGLSKSQQNKVLQGIKDIQDENFRKTNSDIAKDIEKYEDYFTYDVIDNGKLYVELTVHGVGKSYEDFEMTIGLYE